MEKAHFLWDEDRLEEEATTEGPVYDVEEMLEKTYAALLGTSNSSALGPDRINYKILRMANQTCLGVQLMVQVATNLVTGTIPREWQDSKMVFIPKLGKDHTQLKARRPITLINCIGKLGEKVVVEELQTGNLLHRLQFGCVKGRSAIDAVFREVARVQGCLMRKGKAG